jgi:preprotein translocase subunit SecA
VNAVQRPFYYALVDEADSILIDEARTPLIIGIIDQAGEAEKKACYEWSARNATAFVEGQHYKYEHDKRQVKLNPPGWRLLRDLPQTPATRSINIRQLCEYMETAIKAHRDFHLDKHYALVDGKVVIIDEFTGRPAEGRQWQKGLHQAIEAKEGIAITPATHQAATITVQSLFKLYPKFSGMTGTAWTSRREFRKVYKRRVVRIPTHRPVQRKRLPTLIFPDLKSKFEAVVAEVLEMLEHQRPVLIGTRSVDKSEILSHMMSEQNIAHQVLNARHLAREAEIVAGAGQSGRVTIATNMAGRGTDIKLDDSVRQHGGLHVMLTEIHEAERIDWQLIGRASRQGDPGSYRLFLALTDEILLLGLGPKRAQRVAREYGHQNPVPREAFIWFKRAQRRLERKYLVDRMILMEHERQTREQYFDTGQDPYLDVTQ